MSLPDVPDPPNPQYYIRAEDAVFPNVLDRAARIWRYMDMAKLDALFPHLGVSMGGLALQRNYKR